MKRRLQILKGRHNHNERVAAGGLKGNQDWQRRHLEKLNFKSKIDYQPFLKGLVSDQNAPVDSRNVPAPLKHGIENESRAPKQYENDLVNSGHPVKTFPSGFDVNPAFPFLGCSLDGKVIDVTENRPYGIVETKCPYKQRNVTPETACAGDSQFHLEKRMTFHRLRRRTNIIIRFRGKWELEGLSGVTLSLIHSRGWSSNVFILILNFLLLCCWNWNNFSLSTMLHISRQQQRASF